MWIDNTNQLSVSSTNNQSQSLSLSYDSTSKTYLITSLNSVETFDLVANTPDGLTVT